MNYRSGVIYICNWSKADAFDKSSISCINFICCRLNTYSFTGNVFILDDLGFADKTVICSVFFYGKCNGVIRIFLGKCSVFYYGVCIKSLSRHDLCYFKCALGECSGLIKCNDAGLRKSLKVVGAFYEDSV